MIQSCDPNAIREAVRPLLREEVGWHTIILMACFAVIFLALIAVEYNLRQEIKRANLGIGSNDK